eukprot:2361270-Rhodomonas_salina.5
MTTSRPATRDLPSVSVPYPYNGSCTRSQPAPAETVPARGAGPNRYRSPRYRSRARGPERDWRSRLRYCLGYCLRGRDPGAVLSRAGTAARKARYRTYPVPRSPDPGPRLP